VRWLWVGAFKRLSLRARLVFFALLCAVPVLGLSLLQLRDQSEHFHGHAVSEARAVLDRAQARLALLLGSAESLGHALGTSGRLPEPGDPACARALRAARDAMPSVVNYAISDAEGRLLCSATPLPAAAALAGSDLLRQVRQRKRPMLSGYGQGMFSRMPALAMGVPVLDARDEVAGVAFAVIAVEQLAAQLGGSDALAVAMFDSTGTLISHSPPHAAVRPGESAAGSSLFAHVRSGRPAAELTWLDGRPRIYLSRPVLFRGEPVLWVAAGTDLGALAALTRQAQLRELLQLLAVAAAVVALALLATRPVVLARCHGLLEVARQVGQGRYNSRVALTVKDDLTGVEAALNHMLQAIEDERVQLQRSESRYRLLFENSLDGVLQVRPTGDVLAANPAACRMLGRSEESLREAGRGATPIDPELRRLLEQGGPEGQARGELRLLRADGGRFDAEVASSMYLDAQGQPAACVVIRDVTERSRHQRQVQLLNRELEQRVRQRTQELQLANQELEAFSYTVSHDLRAPVAVVDSFSAVLQERGGLTDAKDRHYLERIRAAARHMNELIEGLLVLAHISRATLDWRPVDLSTLAAEVAQECRDAEPGRDVELAIDPGMMVVADARLMRVVLSNLLGNAWKFTRQAARARVRVEMAEGEDGSAVYSVHDNGAGFDEAHALHLFEAFHRLHKPSEFPGLGIGLATVQRVVQRHGGRVWATARPGKGAAFHFVLGSDAGAAPLTHEAGTTVQ
jgi:PAS domain S-box-containing protein